MSLTKKHKIRRFALFPTRSQVYTYVDAKQPIVSVPDMVHAKAILAYLPVKKELPTDWRRVATVPGSCSKIILLAPTELKVSKY